MDGVADPKPGVAVGEEGVFKSNEGEGADGGGGDEKGFISVGVLGGVGAMVGSAVGAGGAAGIEGSWLEAVGAKGEEIGALLSRGGRAVGVEKEELESAVGVFGRLGVGGAEASKEPEGDGAV